LKQKSSASLGKFSKLSQVLRHFFFEYRDIVTILDDCPNSFFFQSRDFLHLFSVTTAQSVLVMESERNIFSQLELQGLESRLDTHAVGQSRRSGVSEVAF
jgi:uncharacterized protein with NAD-binding domain and iron-sulfur cluster